MERTNVRISQRTRENGGSVRRDPDRPEPNFLVVLTEEARQLVGDMTELPLTPVRMVRGRTIGGGTLVDAVRRARRRLAASA